MYKPFNSVIPSIYYSALDSELVLTLFIDCWLAAPFLAWSAARISDEVREPSIDLRFDPAHGR